MKWLLPSLALLALGACASEGPSPTPTKTPGPEPTPAGVFPLVDDLAGVVLDADDLQPGFSPDPEFTGALTPDLIAESSSSETGAYLQSLDNIYGYQSAFNRLTSLADLAVVRDWVIVFGEAGQASEFLRLHPTLIEGEQDFQSVPFPALGEESAAYRATSSNEEGVQVDRHDLVMRRRNVAAVLFVVTAAGYADLVEIENYARRLDAHLAEITLGG